MKATALLIAAALMTPALMATQQYYNLVITHKNGEKTVLPTSNIAKMEFEDCKTGQIQNLAAPVPQLKSAAGNTYQVEWSAVDNAGTYSWTINSGVPTVTTKTSVTLVDLDEGTHIFSITAQPADTDGYEESSPGTLNINVGMKTDISLVSKGAHDIMVTVSSNSSDKTYHVGIVTFGDALTNKDCIAYINGNDAASQKKSFTGKAVNDVTFSGLIQKTKYIIAAYQDGETENATCVTVTTDAETYKPGDKGSVFPPGVTQSNGFVDVDKFGQNAPYGADNELCWACSISGMIQWWLNDYKSVTGTDYPMKRNLPSDYEYTTPVMDAIAQAYTHTSGDGFMTFNWFATGVEYNSVMNNLPTYNESYPDWKGGYLGLSADVAYKVMNIDTDSLSPDPYSPKRTKFHWKKIENKNENETIGIFSELALETLAEGPFYMVIAGSHALSVWGADYTVLLDGSRQVTRLYIGENAPVGANVKGGLNESSVSYSAGNVWLSSLPTIHDGGTSKSGKINMFVGLRSIRFLEPLPWD